jgi:hypothetical protein
MQLDPDELEGHEHVLRSVRTALGEEHPADLWLIENSGALDKLVALVASVLQPGATSRER